VAQYIYIKLSNKILNLIKFSYKFYKSNTMVSLLTQNKPDICDMACYVISSMYVVEIRFITNSWIRFIVKCRWIKPQLIFIGFLSPMDFWLIS